MRPPKALGVVVLLALVAGCTGGATPEPTRSAHRSGSPIFGTGAFRSAIEDFGFSGAFDPTGENSRLGMGLLSQLLLRTLVTYRHVAGPSGLTPVPDLATGLGKVSLDGLTWTFTLKEDVWFGPPVHRPITSADVEFAFRRIDSKPSQAQYGYLYDGLIEGMKGPVDAMPVDIPGIDTPDSRTVIFHLSQPAGDFLHRLALPATAPMPPEVAGCFKKAGDYGRDIVSSGPYMIEGADMVDASRCRSIEPMTGFQPTRDLFLVRNPDYDATTDDPAVRENHPDTIDISIDSNSAQIVHDVDRGRLDATLGAYGVPQMPGPHGYKPHRELLNGLQYLAMNLLVPPFDDVHVRRAVNLALDRNAIETAYGAAAVDIFPPWLSTPSDPPPFPLDGDLAAARREMSLSEYDADKNGMCDAKACAGVLFAPPSVPPDVNAVPLIVDALASIGIHLRLFQCDCGTAYQTAFTVRNLLPIAFARPPLVAAYPDPAAIARSLHSAAISCTYQANFSEVGITERQAAECGVLKQYQAVGAQLPSLDVSINACEIESGQVRSACWATFDAYVMREVVPWAPLRYPDTVIAAGRTITKFEYDQAFGILSLCHIAVADTAI